MAKKSLFNISKQEKDKADKEIRMRQHEVRYDLRDFTIDYIVNEYQSGLFYIPD